MNPFIQSILEAILPGSKKTLASPIPEDRIMPDDDTPQGAKKVYYPGQYDYIRDMVSRYGGSPDRWSQLYEKAVRDPGFSGNYYNQPTATPTPTPTPKDSFLRSVTPTPMQGMQQVLSAQDISIPQDVDSFLQKTVFPITSKYGIPNAVAAGQFAGEGRFKGLGADRKNYYNVMAYDGKEGQMPSFNTPEEGVEVYAKTIAKDPRYANAMKVAKDPKRMIKEIHKAGYATRPDYAEFVASTPEFQKYSQ